MSYVAWVNDSGEVVLLTKAIEQLTQPKATGTLYLGFGDTPEEATKEAKKLLPKGGLA